MPQELSYVDFCARLRTVWAEMRDRNGHQVSLEVAGHFTLH